MSKMTESEHQQARNSDRLREEGITFWSLFMAASLAGGARPVDAAKNADAAMDLTKERWT